jgi:hypothetical protein
MVVFGSSKMGTEGTGEEGLGFMANGALARWGRELDLRETEVQLMEQLTVSWSEPVAHDLEDIRKQLLALGFEAESLLSSRTKPPAPYARTRSTGSAQESRSDETGPVGVTPSAFNEARAVTQTTRANSKSATLSMVADYLNKKEDVPAKPPAQNVRGIVGNQALQGDDAADLLFAALDKDGDGVITKDEMVSGLASAPAAKADRPSSQPVNISGVDQGVTPKRADIVLRQARLKELKERRMASEARLRAQQE